MSGCKGQLFERKQTFAATCPVFTPYLQAALYLNEADQVAGVRLTARSGGGSSVKICGAAANSKTRYRRHSAGRSRESASSFRVRKNGVVRIPRVARPAPNGARRCGMPQHDGRWS